MNLQELKLFAEIYKWSSYYNKDGRNYTPSNKRLSEFLKVDYETVTKYLQHIKSLGLIDITQDENGFRSLVSKL